MRHEIYIIKKKYHTTEQYMMASKARLFGDDEVFGEIMEASNPHDYKKLGRKIRGFEQEPWNAKKYDIVVEGAFWKRLVTVRRMQPGQSPFSTGSILINTRK